MSALKNYLAKTDLSALAISSNIIYGTPIFERGAVEIIEIFDNRIEAWSGGLDGTLKQGAGSKRRVQLWLDGDELRWHCAGNPKSHDIFCKHCVAVALFVQNNR